MEIVTVLRKLFPEAGKLDFIVRDDADGNGPYIDPDAWKLDAPIPSNDELQETWDEMTKPKLDEVKKAKIDELNKACNDAILAGFTSSASGEVHTYAFDYEAQINFAGAKQFFNDNPTLTIEWSTEGGGAVELTKEQFDQLWMDGFVFKNTNIGKYRQLKAQVEAALTVEDVDAIVWA